MFIAILMILIFISASVYVHYYGKILIEEALQNTLNRKVTLEKISYYFPLSLKARNIHISKSLQGGEFFKAQDITAQLSSDTFYQRRLIFDSVTLIKPLVIIEKKKASKGKGVFDELTRRHGIVVLPNESGADSANNSSNVQNSQSKDKPNQVSIKKLILKQGKFQYTNSSIDKDFSFALEDTYLKVQHLDFPIKPGMTDFTITGRLIKKGNPLSGSSVEGHGWIDIIQRNMEVNVEVIEADGSIGMTAQVISKNNDMNVKGEIKFQNIMMGANQNNSSDGSPVNALISNVLSSSGVEIGAKFSFKTKMDDFRPEQVAFSGNVVTK